MNYRKKQIVKVYSLKKKSNQYVNNEELLK